MSSVYGDLAIAFEKIQWPTPWSVHRTAHWNLNLSEPWIKSCAPPGRVQLNVNYQPSLQSCAQFIHEYMRDDSKIFEYVGFPEDEVYVEADVLKSQIELGVNEVSASNITSMGESGTVCARISDAIPSDIRSENSPETNIPLCSVR